MAAADATDDDTLLPGFTCPLRAMRSSPWRAPDRKAFRRAIAGADVIPLPGSLPVVDGDIGEARRAGVPVVALAPVFNRADARPLVAENERECEHWQGPFQRRPKSAFCRANGCPVSRPRLT